MQRHSSRMQASRLHIQDIRARMLQCIRDFFRARDFREVETPTFAPALIPESSIPVFATNYHSYHGSTALYALPSPEYYMKQLLANGSGSIFQISKCFRNAEVLTAQHNIEFSMLEWYTVHGTYIDNIGIQEALLDTLLGDELLQQLIPEMPTHLRPPIVRISLQEAFQRWAGIDLAAALEHLHQEICVDQGDSVEQKGQGLLDPTRPLETLSDAFHRILVDKIEPNLPGDEPVVLIDYPAAIPTTARPRPGTPWAERWELYLGGMEIANCYTEAEAAALADFFAHEHREMGEAGRMHQIDSHFPELIASMPPCSGNALGLDRLLMQLTGEKHIEGVILFPLHANIHP